MASDSLDVLGVTIRDLTMEDALSLVTDLLTRDDRCTRTLFYVNAHTLNLATEDPSYRDVLNGADVVFGDGTGVRWAARLRGVHLRANLNGTDLTPALFERTAGRGFRYYLLGARPEAIDQAAATARELFPGWIQAGLPSRLRDAGGDARAHRRDRRLGPHLLMVAMGNPLQERWIAEHRDALCVPLCTGVGGLFDYWAGNLDRAPGWVRRAGIEWLHILWRQPHKARRYLLGNPRFLLRVVRGRR